MTSWWDAFFSTFNRHLHHRFCFLSPQIHVVWSHHSSNMAYNRLANPQCCNPPLSSSIWDRLQQSHESSWFGKWRIDGVQMQCILLQGREAKKLISCDEQLVSFVSFRSIRYSGKIIYTFPIKRYEHVLFIQGTRQSSTPQAFLYYLYKTSPVNVNALTHANNNYFFSYLSTQVNYTSWSNCVQFLRWEVQTSMVCINFG